MDALAVKAAEAQSEHCAAIQGNDPEAAAVGLEVVTGVWGELDGALRESDVPHPHLLYWRGMIAQCLDKNDQAISDLEGFVLAAEFLTAVDEERQGQMRAMVQDAKQRLRRLNRTTKVGGTRGKTEPKTPSESPSTTVQLQRRRQTGRAMMVAGALVASGGFAVNVGVNNTYNNDSTPEDQWNRARAAVATGLFVGIAGAAATAAGLVVLVTPARGDTQVVWIPGPVTTLSVRF